MKSLLYIFLQLKKKVLKSSSRPAMVQQYLPLKFK